MTDRPEPADTPQEQPQIIIEPDQMAGVWSNYARVSHSPFEFTLDFVRLDFSDAPPTGIVVSRISLSPLMVSQLIDALNLNFAKYTQRAMPPEVRGYDEDRGTDAGDAAPSA